MRRIADHIKGTDGPLLLLLFGVTYYALWVKAVAVLAAGVCYLLQRRKKMAGSLPGPFVFYILLGITGTLSAWWYGAFAVPAYPFVWLYGWLQWLVAGVGFLFLFLFLRQTPWQKARNALQAWVLLNFFFSLSKLIAIMYQSGSLWPYWMQDTIRFGLSTGDYISGITGGSSLVNAACSGLLALYFLQQKQFRWAALNIIVLWLCGSNLIFLLLVLVTLLQVLAYQRRVLKSWLLLLLLVTGYAFTNFSNVFYMTRLGTGQSNAAKVPSSVNRPGNDFPVYAVVSGKQAAALLTSLRTAPAGDSLLLVPDTAAVRRVILALYGVPYDSLPQASVTYPLKAYAVYQTLHYLQQHPRQLWMGAGMGNASGKLALKVSGAGWHGNWPEDKAYVGKPFLNTHLQGLLYMLSLDVAHHSIAHFPNSTYLELITEYGLIGLLLFLIFYVLYFIKIARRYYPQAWLLLAFLLLLLATDYWLETISVTFIFEFLLLLHRYRQTRHES